MCTDCERHAEERNRKYILTAEECVEKGGHEYHKPEKVVVFGSAPYPLFTRTCIYCGSVQNGHQPGIMWDWD